MIRCARSGFIALIAVLLMSFGALAFELALYSSVMLYADSVNTRELRIQANLNATSCIKSVQLMLAKDYFMSGKLLLSEFGCEVSVSNDGLGTIHAHATSTLQGIHGFADF